MLAFVVSLMMMTTFDPSVLTVPIINPEPYATEEQLLWVNELAKCESGGNELVKVLDTNGKYSYGLLQFQLQTWLAYGKDFGATKENIFDGELQREVAVSMLNEGGWKHWFNCGNRVIKKLGQYPS